MAVMGSPGPAGSIDALLMCGDRGASRAVECQSKAFLFLHGKPLFIHVLEALERVGRVRRIFIIGDKERLDHYLALRQKTPHARPVVTLEQRGSLLSNVWNGFLGTLDGYQPGDEERDANIRNKIVLVAPGDAPLISTGEIDEFIDQADMETYDYVAGLTAEKVMRRYYPARGRPGIRMAYLYLREGAFRINNLHLARPFACQNRIVIQQMYRSRYQKDIRNIIRLSRDMWTHHVKLQSLALYFMLQLSLFLAYLGLKRLNRFTRRRTPIKPVTEAIGRILGMRFGCVVTSRGGAALDVDNARDYETMKAMFFEWKRMQENPG